MEGGGRAWSEARVSRGRILGGGLVWIWAVGLLRGEGATRKEASGIVLPDLIDEDDEGEGK